jgi:phosphatidylglycerol:prolipoprotein diacylglycerol transferase
MALAGLIGYFEAKRQHINVDEAINLVLIGLPSVIIGARLYYVFMSWDYYSLHLNEILHIWEGGLAIHGAIIAAIILAIIYCKVRKQDLWQWGDFAVPLAALGQGIGRWGNFFNQEAYGYPTDLPWAMYIDGAYRHPTFLYESIIDIILFFVLFRILRRPHKKGTVLCLYLIFYSAARFFIESLRTDSLMVGSLRAAMLVSLIAIAAGIIILIIRRKEPIIDYDKLPEGVMTIDAPPKKAKKVKKNK